MHIQTGGIAVPPPVAGFQDNIDSFFLFFIKDRPPVKILYPCLVAAF